MASWSWRPSSTHIASVGFDGDTDTLTVEFVDGRSYDYLNVPSTVAREFQNAPSAGGYLNRHIKGRYAAQEV